MAPGSRGRRRPPKIPKGGSRMDAALDAMRPYGFSDDLIVETMKELLNVYTDEGWHFIEDSSYGVLREALLEKVVEESDKMDDESLGHGSGSGSNTIAAVPSSEINTSESQVIETVGTLAQTNYVPDPSNMEISASESQVIGTVHTLAQTNNDPDSSNMEISGSESQVIETADTVAQTNNVLDSYMEISACESQVIETVHTLAQTKNVPDPSNMEISAIKWQVTETIDTSSQTNVPGESKSNSPPRFINFPERLDTLPTRKQRPYHGWVSKNDEEPDLVHLTPAPLPKAMQDLFLFLMNRRRRWNVKSKDMQPV